MSKELPKTYDHSDVESRLYEKWEKKGYFHAEANPEKKPYCIVMPPPNITGKQCMPCCTAACLHRRRSSICSIVRAAASMKRSGCTEKLKRKRERENRRCVPSVFCISEKFAKKERKVLTEGTSPDIINLALRR